MSKLQSARFAKEIVSGRCYTIAWAFGSDEAQGFYDDLSAEDQAKMDALFERLADHGEIKNEKKFKKLAGTKLYQFKSFQLRFIGGFRPGKLFILAHAVTKKDDRHMKSDLKKAARILTSHDLTAPGDKKK